MTACWNSPRPHCQSLPLSGWLPIVQQRIRNRERTTAGGPRRSGISTAKENVSQNASLPSASFARWGNGDCRVKIERQLCSFLILNRRKVFPTDHGRASPTRHLAGAIIATHFGKNMDAFRRVVDRSSCEVPSVGFPAVQFLPFLRKNFPVTPTLIVMPLC